VLGHGCSAQGVGETRTASRQKNSETRTSRWKQQEGGVKSASPEAKSRVECPGLADEKGPSEAFFRPVVLA